MGVSKASSTLDRWLTSIWLLKLCGVLSDFCVSLRTGRLRSGTLQPSDFVILTVNAGFAAAAETWGELDLLDAYNQEVIRAFPNRDYNA